MARRKSRQEGQEQRVQRQQEIQHRYYDSIMAYQSVTPNPMNQKYGNKDHELTAMSWYGTKTRAEAEEIIKAGRWQEGLDRLEEKLETLEAMQATETKRKLYRGDHGDELDIHAVNRGQFATAWTSRKRKLQPSRITVTFPLFASYKTKAEDMFWRGAAALKLADILTEAGHAVRIVGLHGTRCYENRKLITYDCLTVKDYEAPLDKQALVVSMCLPGFSRIAGFNVIKSIDFDVTGSLGEAIYQPLQAIEPHARDGREITGLYEFVVSATTANAWIKLELSKLEQMNSMNSMNSMELTQ